MFLGERCGYKSSSSDDNDIKEFNVNLSTNSEPLKIDLKTSGDISCIIKVLKEFSEKLETVKQVE